MMITFREFVEKFKEAAQDPKALEAEAKRFADNPEVQAVANDPAKLKQKIIELKNKNKAIFQQAIKGALASIPSTS